jgi:hypothetical protein
MCKVGTFYGIYVDGTRVATTTDADSDTFEAAVLIGDNSVGSAPVTGYMDEIRMSNADIFSAGGATITAPTARAVPVSSTKLLIRTDAYDLAGWMTEIRVLKGTAAWTSSFKRPIGRYA